MYGRVLNTSLTCEKNQEQSVETKPVAFDRVRSLYLGKALIQPKTFTTIFYMSVKLNWLIRPD